MATRHGNKWQVNIRYNGQLIRERFDTQLEAEVWEAQAKAFREAGMPLPDRKTGKNNPEVFLGPFIDDVFDDLWGGRAVEKTYRYLATEVEQFFGRDKELTKLTTAEIDRFLKHCKETKGNSNGTLNRKIAFLSKLLKKAHAREYIQKLPVFSRKKEPEGRKRFMTDDEEAKLLRNLRALGFYEAAYRCQFMIYTGARDGEVRNLQWSDIQASRSKDGTERTLVTLDGKTGHRTFPLPQKALEALEWSKAEGNPKPFPMAYETFHEHWEKVAERMGYGDDPTWVPYVMRHTCASRLVQKGVDLRRVRDWMGHEAIKTTMGYAHLAPDDLDTCASVLDAA